ncbi:MAG: hypothetical protein ACR2GY_13100 [Phycisphaerales bacterium]
MRASQADRWSIALTLAVSGGVHLLVLVPFFTRIMHPPTDDAPTLVALDQLQQRDDLALGLDDGSPSTLDWIGYREYEEHLAQLSETNQAAFTPAPGDALTEIVEPAQPRPSEPQQPLVESQLPETQLTELEPLDQTPLDEEAQPIAAQLDAVTIPEATSQLDTAVASALDAFRPAPWFAIVKQQQPEEAAELPDAQDPSAQHQQQPESARPTGGEKGDLSETQSDATSTIKVSRDQWQAGKPLAAQGLELIPRKPQFQILTLITAMPRNPSYRLTIDSRGTVTNVALVRSSLDATVDRNVADAIYAWRARGERIDALEEGSSFTIDIHILLVRER